MSNSAASQDGGLSLDEWKQIDDICTRFEAACRGGIECDPGLYLGETLGPVRERLVRELIAIDLEARRGRGEKPEAQEYRNRFPAHLESVDQVFADQKTDDPAFPPATLRKGRASKVSRQRLPNSPSREAGCAGRVELGRERGARCRRLPSPGRARPRRNGGCLPGQEDRAQPALRPQDDPGRRPRRCRLPRLGSAPRPRPSPGSRHPDIVQIYHVGEADGLPYLELEYSQAAAWTRRFRACLSRPRPRPAWLKSWPEPSPRRTSLASSIAT